MTLNVTAVEKPVRRFLNTISVFSLSYCGIYISQVALKAKYPQPKLLILVSSTCFATGTTYLLDKLKYRQ